MRVLRYELHDVCNIDEKPGRVSATVILHTNAGTRVIACTADPGSGEAGLLCDAVRRIRQMPEIRLGEVCFDLGVISDICADQAGDPLNGENLPITAA